MNFILVTVNRQQHSSNPEKSTTSSLTIPNGNDFFFCLSALEFSVVLTAIILRCVCVCELKSAQTTPKRHFFVRRASVFAAVVNDSGQNSSTVHSMPLCMCYMIAPIFMPPFIPCVQATNQLCDCSICRLFSAIVCPLALARSRNLH